jgi:hypothetical protein
LVGWPDKPALLGETDGNPENSTGRDKGAKEISLGDICCIQEYLFGIQRQGDIQKPE